MSNGLNVPTSGSEPSETKRKCQNRFLSLGRISRAAQTHSRSATAKGQSARHIRVDSKRKGNRTRFRPDMSISLSLQPRQVLTRNVNHRSSVSVARSPRNDKLRSSFGGVKRVRGLSLERRQGVRSWLLSEHILMLQKHKFKAVALPREHF